MIPINIFATFNIHKLIITLMDLFIIMCHTCHSKIINHYLKIDYYFYHFHSAVCSH